MCSSTASPIRPYYAQKGKRPHLPEKALAFPLSVLQQAAVLTYDTGTYEQDVLIYCITSDPTMLREASAHIYLESP